MTDTFIPPSYRACPMDVIQLDPEHCRWGPILCIVDEVRDWGVTCYSPYPSEKADEVVPLRVQHGHYVIIGQAEWAMAPSSQLSAVGRPVGEPQP